MIRELRAEVNRLNELVPETEERPLKEEKDSLQVVDGEQEEQDFSGDPIFKGDGNKTNLGVNITKPPRTCWGLWRFRLFFPDGNDIPRLKLIRFTYSLDHIGGERENDLPKLLRKFEETIRFPFGNPFFGELDGF
ncbi:hypothetical protein GXN76_08255 [Kroppenstedtia pulmonis]|uniref:Uncharacterized protein n=1 Tax=Kroppenstedtia pulmonis TaxID=1380685 RepID=A0A7D3XQ52_9BACL|nr:hypothetical protein [Kroppenstedtia pulmonis]QKG84467.1 hypothetical protein GXN76_08255 [Kroppenstedtia pulmonis]